MILMPILLLNMLIATMGELSPPTVRAWILNGKEVGRLTCILVLGNTFNTVIQRSRQEWFAQYAKTVITLERAFKKTELETFQNMYTQKMNPKTSDSRYQQGQGHNCQRDWGSVTY